ncbi:ATP-binding cassette domain-containing protein [Plantactinospora siamensis]|uniref:ATP-binding cassette domain-containing protein n=1 Tax=Plantactinospora siamensis TaxID=555372 RepID=A0ABV6P2R7_9ACTN
MRATLQLDGLVAAPGTGPVGVLVQPGELVAVVARPPVGTALARVVLGLAAPLAGRVRVGGRDVTALPPAGRQVGYVPAGGGLLPHLSVRSNIGYGQRRREEVHAVIDEWIDTVVDRLELAPSLRLLPHQLNEAQRFRVALARAAAGLPEVLVVDLPAPADGADRLPELLSRIAPRDSAGVAALACLADTVALDGVTRRVAVPAAGDAAPPPDAPAPPAGNPAPPAGNPAPLADDPGPPAADAGPVDR